MFAILQKKWSKYHDLLLTGVVKSNLIFAYAYTFFSLVVLFESGPSWSVSGITSLTLYDIQDCFQVFHSLLALVHRGSPPGVLCDLHISINGDLEILMSLPLKSPLQSVKLGLNAEARVWE